MKPTTRQELIDYCLRELGHPVIEINVDEDQLDDRVDEAFAFYREYHYDAIERLYTVHTVTQQDIDRQYIALPDSITGVVRVIPRSSTTSDNYMFDINYQLRMNDLFDLYSTSMIYYTQVQQHLTMIDQYLRADQGIEFNRHMNRLKIHVDWGVQVKVGDRFIIECYAILDPDTYTDVYSDRMLKKYATALIKKQWGTNMKKFSGIQLPGGVTLNGKETYDEAVEEIKELEEEFKNSFQEPPGFMVG
jgi:hypothetical protein